MSPTNHRAVLFDLDGVLIDSPKAHTDAWIEVFRRYGVTIPPRRIYLEEGKESRGIAAGLNVEYDLKLTEWVLDELIAEKRRLYRQNAPQGMRPDAHSAVTAALSLGWRTGLVSGSVRTNIQAVLSPRDLDLFETVVAAGDYSHGKPHPEPFLTACRKLGVQPSDCIAVENAPLGIKAAKAAGLKVVALTTTLSPEDLREADVILDDLFGFEDIL
ncbi:MAG: HAD family phosphatase, partial [Calditrichota bacterium]